MEPTRWEVSRREPYAKGRAFGDAGAFEIVEGRVHYRVDPDDPRNAGIVDLALAPRDDDGMVAFSGDFTLVAPERGRVRKLFLDVPNRGRRLAFSMFNRALPDALLEDPCAPGDGFLFQRGFAVASIGWQWDAPGLRLDAPTAESEEPIVGEVVCRIQPGSDRPFVSFGQLGEVAYPPLRLDDPEARLFMRTDDTAPHVEVPRETWRFGRSAGRAGEREPDPRFIHKDGGFEKGRIYTLVYQARNPRVVGCGLLALRDAAASLRCGEGPAAGGFEQVLGFGASQTGRVLRHLLHLGLNSDAAGNRVFDGVHIHIAGGQRGDFNHRFAQPSSAGVPAAGQRFPFAGTCGRDPLTGEVDGLYRRLESSPGKLMPKVVVTNTSWEYWRGDAALVHAAPDGSADLAPHPAERGYLFAGTHHIGGVLPPTNVFALTGERARYTFNMVDHAPLTRAAFVNLSRWLDGHEPPPSALPTLAAGTLVERGVVLEKFAAKDDGFHGLDPARLGGLSALDLGEEADRGICRFPAQEGRPYARLVADVDASLNEVAGVRLPDIAVPVGCHTGWNPRHPANGAPDLPAIFVGFTRFDDAADLPPEDDYRRRVRAWTRRLVEERFVLDEDFERVVDNCMERYRLAKQSGGSHDPA